MSSPINFLGRAHDINMPESFSFETTERPAQLLGLLTNDMRTKIPIRPLLISVLTDFFLKVKNDSDGQTMKLSRYRNQWLSRLRLHIGCVHYSQFSCRQPLAGDEMQDFKGIRRGCLVVLVIRNQPATVVGGNYFG